MNCCVVGLQWGDEGKGKVVDILAEHCDIVVRYSGGANAGHTVIVGDAKFALHLLPSGSVRPDKTCLVTNAVVVDPEESGGASSGTSLRLVRSRHRTLSFRFDPPAAWRNRVPTRDGKTYPLQVQRAVYETLSTDDS